MATVDDETFLGAEMRGVSRIPVLQLQMDGMRLFAAQGARVPTESAMMFLDVTNHGFALRLHEVATRTLKSLFAFPHFFCVWWGASDGKGACGEVERKKSCY